MSSEAMARPGPDALPERVAALARWGARIGLLGGSFNPAHEGHRHISLVALRRLKLDLMWWLVSPQNPLKSTSEMAPLARRLQSARETAAHPDIAVSAIEVELGTQYTIDTIAALQRLFPRAHFVWVMGGDSMASFHLWKDWEEIPRRLPMAVIARPGFTTKALTSPAGVALQAARVRDAATLADRTPPAWAFIHERLDGASATALRNRGVWR
jgi:nicotinate-nucleotide adenylyltransferase